MLTEILAVLLAIAAALGGWFRVKQTRAEAERDHARREADQATAKAEARVLLHELRGETSQRHHEEQRTGEERLAAGRRDHLEQNW